MRQCVFWIVLLCVYSEQSYGQKPLPSSSRHNHPTSGCLVDDVWYRVGQSIHQVHDRNWCHFIYCGKDGVVLEWESYACDPTITIQEIMNNQKIDVSFSHGSKNIPPPQNLDSRKGPGPRQSRGSLNRTSKLQTVSSNKTAESTVSTSRAPSDNINNEGCVRGPSIFNPGDVMSERQVGNLCTITYCDVNSRVQRESRECSDPYTRPQVLETSPATDAPVQSSLRSFEDSLIALTLLNMLRN